MTTPKRFARPVGLTLNWMNVQAIMARLRGIRRIHQNQFHAKLNTLVSQELAQLVETPRVTSTPLSLGSRQFVGTFPDAGQVLQGNNLIVGLRLLDKLIADDVVLMCLKAFLLARQPFQKRSSSTPSTSRAQSLAFCWRVALKSA